jgi:hypothetical protein
MLPDDPACPSLTTLKTWVTLRSCAFCKTAAMRKPAEPAVHPPVPRRSDISNGEGLHIDCLGTNPMQTIDGSTDTFLFVDDHSSIQLAFPTHTTLCAGLLSHIQEYQAASSVKLKFIHTDNAFMCEQLTTWCRTNNFALTACAPHTHVQNPKAERGLSRVQETLRKHKHTTATSDYLLPYNYIYTCQVLNSQPCDNDPENLHCMPLQI